MLLNSQWMAERLSNIDGVEIRWEHARSQHPGRWEVENLALHREDDVLPVSIEVEHADLSLSLMELLRGRLHIDALEARGIRRLRIADIALEAEGALSLRDTELGRESLGAAQIDLDIQQGRLVRLSDAALLAQDIQLSARSQLEPVSTHITDEELVPALLEAISTRIDASARADAWDVFMPYLEGLPWLGIAGRGELTLAVGLDHGVPTEASELSLSAPSLRVELDERGLANAPTDGPPTTHHATGNGRVRLSVRDSRLDFTAELDDVELADTAPYATETALTLETQVANRRLDLLEPPEGATLALQGEVTRLDMLERYLSALASRPVALAGQGRLALDLEVREAALYRGEADVEASALEVAYAEFTARGDGALHIERPRGSPAHARLTLSDARLTHQGRALLTEAEIALDATSAIEATTLDDARARLEWRGARLPDIRALAPYLNAALPRPQVLTLLGGQARSHGTLVLAERRLDGEIALAGERWVTRLPGASDARTLTSDVALTLKVAGASLDGRTFDLGGSRLRWQTASDVAPSERLESILVLREGHFERRGDDTRARFDVAGVVQRLGFLNAFLPAGHGVALSGGGELFAQGAFAQGELQAPTRLRVNANALEARFLDYVATGRGELSAELTSSDDASMSLAIPRFTLRRESDARAALEGRHLTLATETDRFRAARAAPLPAYFTTRVELPIVEVPDLALYADYLPATDGLRLLGGEASLESAWHLAGLHAEGDITLRAFGAELTLLDQHLRGDIDLHLALAEGDLETRRFRANDSYVSLENVFRLDGGGAQDAGWWVRLEMPEAELTWSEPIQLDSTVRLSMRDTGLLARLFLSRARESGWLGRLLEVHGVEGEATLKVRGERIELQDLTLTGGSLQLLSDITLEASKVSGALYARLGALGIGAELIEGEAHLRLLQPRRWFDRWRQAQRQPRP
ncbi:hypothetical protein [Vreelandella malpeensis]|uniref:hypothetical protein n=1 Tax=Vreelandella malpeensis TaxID=1172368 RepID=UPI001D09A813